MSSKNVVIKEQIFVNEIYNYALFGTMMASSIIGCLVIILTYMLYKEIRTPSRHLIVCISLADLIFAIGSFVTLFVSPEISNLKDFCYLDGFIVSTAFQWSFLWTIALAVYLYILIVHEKPHVANSLHTVFHLICWLVPLVINVAALILKKIGMPHDYSTPGWCWIGINVSRNDISGEVRILNKEDAEMWMIINGKALEIFTYIVVTALYLRIKCHLGYKLKKFAVRDDSTMKSPDSVSRRTFKAAKATDRKLMFIPVVLVLLRIWGTVRFFLFVAKPSSYKEVELNNIEKALIVLQGIGDNIVGAVNCVLFCFLTPKVLNNMKASLRKLCYDADGSRRYLDSADHHERTKLLSEAR